jgi:hypothetical protein
MFERLINKKIKCVWNDDNNSKAVSGILKTFNDNFLEIYTENGNNIIISVKSIITIKEVGE